MSLEALKTQARAFVAPGNLENLSRYEELATQAQQTGLRKLMTLTDQQQHLRQALDIQKKFNTLNGERRKIADRLENFDPGTEYAAISAKISKYESIKTANTEKLKQIFTAKRVVLFIFSFGIFYCCKFKKEVKKLHRELKEAKQYLKNAPTQDQATARAIRKLEEDLKRNTNEAKANVKNRELDFLQQTTLDRLEREIAQINEAKSSRTFAQLTAYEQEMITSALEKEFGNANIDSSEAAYHFSAKNLVLCLKRLFPEDSIQNLKLRSIQSDQVFFQEKASLYFDHYIERKKFEARDSITSAYEDKGILFSQEELTKMIRDRFMPRYNGSIDISDDAFFQKEAATLFASKHTEYENIAFCKACKETKADLLRSGAKSSQEAIKAILTREFCKYISENNKTFKENILTRRNRALREKAREFHQTFDHDHGLYKAQLEQQRHDETIALQKQKLAQDAQLKREQIASSERNNAEIADLKRQKQDLTVAVENAKIASQTEIARAKMSFETQIEAARAQNAQSLEQQKALHQSALQREKHQLDVRQKGIEANLRNELSKLKAKLEVTEAKLAEAEKALKEKEATPSL